MRWAFASIVVIVAGAVGAFAIYRFSGGDSTSSRSEALIAAHELAGVCSGSCHAADVQHLTGDIWKLSLVFNRSDFSLPSRSRICLNVHLDHYASPETNASTLAGIPGVAVTDC